MTRNFHRWEMDPFFYAAEQVQESADRLESVYRTWMHMKGQSDDDALECCRRELATALGTAKWQLDEFEKAVSFLPFEAAPRHQSHDQEDATERHRQFTDAIRSHIQLIENTIALSTDARDLKALPVVSLNEYAKDELALFLCGSRNSCSDEKPSKLRKGDECKVETSSSFSSLSSNSTSLVSKAGVSDQSGFSSSSSDLAFQRGKLGHELGSREDHGICYSSSELLLRSHDDMDHDIIKKRVIRHQRSISLGDEFVFSKDSKRNHRQADTSAKLSLSSANIWSLFSKPVYSRNGFKRLKDGDDCHDGQQQMSSVDIEKGLHNLDESLNSYLDAKQCGSWAEPLQTFRYSRSSYPSRRHIQIASAVLAVFGLLGLLSFQATV